MTRLGTEVIVLAAAFLSVAWSAETEQGGLKPLNTYPLADRVWLGSFGGEVEVNPKSELLAVRNGDVEWLVDEGGKVGSGEAVAITGAAQVRQSAEQLEIEEAALPVKLKQAEWNDAEKKASLERQIEEIEGRIGKLELSPKERKLLGGELVGRLRDEREKLEGQLAILHEKLEPAFRAAELELEQRQLRQDLARKRVEHEDLIANLEIPSPHEGTVRVFKRGIVRANDVIGAVVRSGRAAVRLQVLDPEIRSEAPETLSISVSGPTGELVGGAFSKIERGMASRLAPVVYEFTLKDTAEAPLTDELAGERVVTVYKLLGREARVVPKAGFLFSNTAEIQRLGWKGFLGGIWPEARVIYIGPRSLALVEGK